MLLDVLTLAAKGAAGRMIRQPNAKRVNVRNIIVPSVVAIMARQFIMRKKHSYLVARAISLSSGSDPVSLF